MDEATGQTQIENDHFRVTEWTIRAGEHIPLHVHEFEYVVIPLVTDSMFVVQEDGSEFESHLVTGQSYTRPAGSMHRIENRTPDRTIQFIEVEKLS